ncbi:MAG: hypothetical protein PHC95_10385 [Parabacteroides sp.]|nr:hypothetical protein [Parabacteroides sp.]
MTEIKPYGPSSKDGFKVLEPIASYSKEVSLGCDLPILTPEEMDMKINRALEQIANGDVVSHKDMSAFLRKYQV